MGFVAISESTHMKKIPTVSRMHPLTTGAVITVAVIALAGVAVLARWLQK